MLSTISTGCQPSDEELCGLTILLEDTHADECLGICGDLTGPSGARVIVESDSGDLAVSIDLDRQGHGSFCLEGPLAPGTHNLHTRAESGECQTTSAVFESHPFGWAWGLEKESTVLDEVPWVPDIEGLDRPPIFSPNPLGWDSAVVSMPSIIDVGDQRLLYYSGRNVTSEYALGVAIQDSDGGFSRPVDAPLLSDQLDDWNIAARNTPEAILRDDEIWLFYNGQDTREILAIGAARSVDGVVFEQLPDNPLLTAADLGPAPGKGNSVAHTSLIEHESGVTEMWFATGTLWLGYALSTDGEHFEPYCDNPIFEGLNTWDRGMVKAPEVVHVDDTYWMTFSGCDRGCYQVGWGASIDGLRWTFHPEPLLPASGDGSWNGVAVQGAEIELDGDNWKFWYAGTGATNTAIGVASATR